MDYKWSVAICGIFFAAVPSTDLTHKMKNEPSNANTLNKHQHSRMDAPSLYSRWPALCMKLVPDIRCIPKVNNFLFYILRWIGQKVWFFCRIHDTCLECICHILQCSQFRTSMRIRRAIDPVLLHSQWPVWTNEVTAGEQAHINESLIVMYPSLIHRHNL